MVFSRVQSASNGGVTASLAVTLPAAPAAGNLLVCWWVSGSAATLSNSGWTAGPRVDANLGTASYYKIAGAGESSTVTFTQSSNDIAAGFIEYAGNLASPFDVSNTSSVLSDTGGLSVTAASVTTTADHDLIVGIASLRASNTAGSPTAPTWTAGLSNVIAQGDGQSAAGNTTVYGFCGDLLDAGAAGASSVQASWSTTQFKQRAELVLAFKAAASPTSWSADFAQADAVAAGFQDANWNRSPTTLPWPMPIVAAPDGIRSLQVNLPSGGQRNEVLPVPDFAAGATVWFGFSLYLPSGFDTTANAGSGFQVVSQMRQADDNGSPVFALEVRNGSLLATGGYGVLGASPANQYQYSTTLLSITTGQRYYITYRVGPFSTTAGASTADVYVNTTQVLTGFTVPPPTLIGGNTYPKLGWYRDAANTYAGYLYPSHARIGTSFADVDSTPAVAGGSAVPVSLDVLRAGTFHAAM